MMGFFDRFLRRDSKLWRLMKLPPMGPPAASQTLGPVERLRQAIQKGDAATVATILAADGVDPNAPLSGHDDWTPLCKALVSLSDRDVPSMVETLLKAGASASLPGGGGRAPVVIAAARDTPDALQALLTQGVDPNSVSPQSGIGHADHTALFAAVGNERPSNVEVLLAAGVDPFQQDPDGRTALYLAFQRAGGDTLGDSRRSAELIYTAMSKTRGRAAAEEAQVTALLDLYEGTHARVIGRQVEPRRRAALARKLSVMSPFIMATFVHDLKMRNPLLGGRGGEDIEPEDFVRRFEQWQPACDICKEVIGTKWHYGFESLELVEVIALQCAQCRLFACIKHVRYGADGSYPAHNRCGSKFEVLYPGPASASMVARATREGVYVGAVASPETLWRPVIAP